MAEDSCLVLYGNSVFLGGIKAELERNTPLDLITVEVGSPVVTDLIRLRKPRAVLFDLSEGQPDFSVTLLHEQPGLLLIGVDPSSDDLLVLSNQPVQARSLPDLFKVIFQKRSEKETIKGER
jgi:hypothetical protein